MIILLAVPLFLALVFVVFGGATWVVQWGLTEITELDMPFWPIFWMLIVFSAIFGGSTKAGNL